MNLALKKRTSSTVLGKNVPSLAVDGNLSQSYYSCGHTVFGYGQKVAWWQVDLALTAEIINITIYYRENKDDFIAVRRLNGFQITVGMNTIWNNKEPCYRDNVAVYPLDITTIHICTGPGRYVTIFNYHIDQNDTDVGPILELCEVQIFGCTPNKYGTECTFDCHCKQKGCYRRDGICFTPGCEIGWEGNSCNKMCGENTFGFGCASRCNCLQGTCNHITGICYKQGCQAGWQGLTCSKPCDANQNKFGPDCNFICHCLQGTCYSKTGVCDEKGCLEGWQGPTCSTPCETNNFGRDCIFTCHCLTGSCPPSTGLCTDKICEPGWLTETCSQPCVNNTFGEGCNSICHCNHGTCNNSNGHCFKKSCKPGWKGNSCSSQCTDNTFGPDCKFTCHCLTGTCDRINGTCTIPGCKPGYQSKTCSEHMIKFAIPEIVGVLVGGLSFILATVLTTAYICWKRRKQKGKDDVDVSQNIPDDALDHVYHELGPTENTGTDYSVIQTDSIKETSHVLSAFNTTILMMGNIKNEVAEKIKNGTLQNQYKKIPYGSLYPQTAGNLTKNKKKNRNQNVLPYDHSRVILDTSDQNQDADYINANYIDGPTQDSTYIATQGPMKNTFDDFWRMVWQTKSSIIVMLANVIEDKEVTCFQYWPVPSSILACLDYEIIPVEEQRRSEFITRKLHVKNTKTGEIRHVCHLQFTSWPRQGYPIPYQLFLLHRKCTEINSTNNSAPVIVHCSDGIDRTGIFIAFDVISKCFYRNEAIDICMFVTEMRKKRINMVATEESYVLLHKLLLEVLQFETTHIATYEFLRTIQQGENRKDREYEMLMNNLPEYDDKVYKEAILAKNRGKHRNQSILPVETYRLNINKGGAGHYVNAVAIPSCRMSEQFLVTQIPLISTMADLWRLIFEYNSCTIVNLEDEPSF